MNFSEITSISEFGLNVERLRLKAAAFNIANENTLYNKDMLMSKSLGALEVNASPRFIDSMKSQGTVNYYYNGQLRSIHKPGHAAADKDGMIHMPNINLSAQMIALTSAERAYEANIKVINTIYSMAQKTMEIGDNR